MDDGFSYIPPASQCHYLPEQLWQLEHRWEPDLSSQQYFQLVQNGWRRFGPLIFRPACPSCTACQPLRVIVDSFRPDRSQRRVQKLNQDTKLLIGAATIDQARLDLYYRHHQHHAETKGWPFPDKEEDAEHLQRIIAGPLPVQEWAYYRDDRLVAIGYIDDLTEGYSGIYFYHDPEYRKYSLGTWICLSMIEQAAIRKMPFVYFGYYIADCRSMAYKGKFIPNQVLVGNGTWEDFIS